MAKYDWKSIKKDYDNGFSDDQLVKKYNVNIGTLRSRRQRHGWGSNNPKTAVSNLSAEEIYFCELYARNLPQYRAFQIAFNQNNMPNAQASQRAYKQLIRPVIKSKIAQIIKSKQHERRWDYDQYIDEILRMYYMIVASVEEEGIKKANTDAWANAIDKVKDALNFDKLTQLKRDETKARVAVLKAKLKQLDGTDNKEMSQVEDLLDKIDSQL